MSLISLKNVSKFYYSKGVIASGFTKVNLDLNDGEFVAITGESGSGKSTLLNVISGLDSYEEGEMYINGHETSHYTEKDFEDYRRKYIGNIFQSFNLVNSYTVYQNIELVLILNGYKKKNIKKNVLDLIRKVGLYKFRNTKVSKLSGGMKQRVAIARALAKETPIIIADEPTGNLDSKSATDVLKLLSEVSKDKLVIVVTHNYEQIEKYVTRKITMHDGRITEDKTLKQIDKVNNIKTSNYKNITFFNKLRLGIRNAFNIKVKFLLLLFIFAFVAFALCFEYSSNKDDQYILKKSGDNSYFSNKDDKRIVIYKKNKEIFNDVDYENIKKIDEVDYIIKNDILTDNAVEFTNDKQDVYIYGSINNLSAFNQNIDVGRMPENDYEILAVSSDNDYYLNEQYEQILDAPLYLNNGISVDKSVSYKIVGIVFAGAGLNNETQLYVTDKTSVDVGKYYIYNTAGKKIKFNETFEKLDNLSLDRMIVSSALVKEGQAIVSSDLNYYCKYQNCLNKNITINVNNQYYTEEISLKVSRTYNKNSFKRIFNIKEYWPYERAIFINNNDYNRLFNKGIYQSSVYVKDVKLVDDAIKKLHNLGYNTFTLRDHLIVYEPLVYMQIFAMVIAIILVVVLFFISYFVTRVILKSRKVYFSTIRMLGSTKKTCKHLLTIELLVISNISYLLFVGSLLLTKLNIIKLGVFKMIINYFELKEIIILYILINIMTFIISIKYSNKIFKNTVINTLKEDN